MNKKLGALALLGASAVVLAGCAGGTSAGNSATPEAAELRVWLVGTDTPQDARDYLTKTFAEENPGFAATDDASLMEWFGVPVACVQGDPMAFKITTPLDYALAKAVTDEAEPTIFEVPDE